MYKQDNKYKKLTRIMTLNSDDLNELKRILGSDTIDNMYLKGKDITSIIINYHIMTNKYNSYLYPFRSKD